MSLNEMEFNIPNVIYFNQKKIMVLDNNTYKIYNIDAETKKQTLELATPNLKKAEEIFFENNANIKQTGLTKTNKLQNLFNKYKIN
jgi:hypothetical protein